MGSGKKERTAITIDPGLHSKLKRYADQEKTSVSSVIGEACSSFLKDKNIIEEINEDEC